MQNKSDQSTTFEPMMDPSIFQCLQKIKEQNQYLKKALITSQSLIKNYQQENNRLQIEIKILECKLKKNYNTQAYNNAVSYLKQSKTSRQKKQKIMDWDIVAASQKQHEKELQIQELNEKIKKLVKIQQRYEQKITEMQKKIILLQRNKADSKIHKQNFALNINQNYFSTFMRQSQKKTKNLSQLRALHLKLKTKEAEDESSRQKDESKTGKRLVQRVFSKERIGNGVGGSRLNCSSSSKKKIDHKISEMKRKY